MSGCSLVALNYLCSADAAPEAARAGAQRAALLEQVGLREVAAGLGRTDR